MEEENKDKNNKPIKLSKDSKNIPTQGQKFSPSQYPLEVYRTARLAEEEIEDRKQERKSRDLIGKTILWLFVFAVIVCLTLWFLNSLNIYIKVGTTLIKLVSITGAQLNILTSTTVAEIAGMLYIVIRHYLSKDKRQK